VIDVSSALHPALAVHAAPARAYGWETWLLGTVNGVAEIFLQDSWISGLLILLAIAVASQISALMAALGSFLAIAVGIFFGAPEPVIRAGMFWSARRASPATISSSGRITTTST
jgi:urea transporter